METTTEKGRKGEEWTADFLERHGYIILERNYKKRGGEIDIIAVKDDVVAFVEVKTRKKNSLVSGFDAVTNEKKKRIVNTAVKYIWEKGIEKQVRYDIAEVIYDNDKAEKLRYMPNAFDASFGDKKYLY